MNKRIIFFLLLAVFFLGAAYSQSQQLTRIAIVDLPRVYTEFFRDSQAVREFEARSARVQTEIDRMTREIQTLRSRHAEAIQNDNQADINRLETEINRRQENLRNYYQARTTELERERSQLMRSGTFLNEVNDEIRLIAERNGFTHVFDRSNTPGLVWFNSSFDITDILIQGLRARNRN